MHSQYKHSLICLTLIVSVCSHVRSFAYGNDGHTIVGMVADMSLKDTRAGSEVSNVLGGGKNLGDVATWADKIKSGAMGDSDMDQFLATHTATNGSTLDHHHFHYTDIPFEESEYPSSGTGLGANDQDIVHSITDCILILQGKPALHTWFQNVNKRTALILLAHYVGDIHQPLHVGAGYVAKHGTKFRFEDSATAAPDQGGGLLQFQAGNLHGYWDSGAVTHARTLATPAGHHTDQAFAEALFIIGAPELTPGDPSEWPAQWATEILPIARAAHVKLKITGTAQIHTQHGDVPGWAVTPAAPETMTKYKDFAAEQVTTELRLGGFRLAQICQAIWPEDPNDR